MQRKIGLLITIILMGALLAACASEQPAKQDNEKITQFNKLGEEDDTVDSDEASEQPITGLHATGLNGVTLYFLDETVGQLSPETRKLGSGKTIDELALYILKELAEGPETSGLSPVFPEDVKINRVDIADNILVVDLSAAFNESEEPALARAALVNSLLDIGAFKYIKLYIDGRVATVTPESQSAPLGLLTRYPMIFAEIKALEEQNYNNQAMRKVNWELFFQDNSGKYLLSEVRPITIAEGKAAETIVNELIKGPVAEGEGYYPTLPKGTTLQKAEIIHGKNGNTGIAVFFSKEFRTQFSRDAVHEHSMISSLVYSLTSLPDVNFVKIYYDNGHGRYIDDPVHSIDLNKELTKEDYPDKPGRRIRVYFGNNQCMLVPEYRAISGREVDIAYRILKDLTTDPVNPDSVRVLPPHISVEDIHLEVKGELAVVDLPFNYFDEMELDNKKIIRDLYALVNSLTDPMNGTGIKEVQFTVGGRIIESYMDISLKDSFVMNPALISEE
jgi:spore germination protein GerM